MRWENPDGDGKKEAPKVTYDEGDMTCEERIEKKRKELTVEVTIKEGDEK